MEKTQGLRPALRNKLAREARRLAMECADGTAPVFNALSYCGCAVGEIVTRATGRRPVSGDPMWVLARDVDAVLSVNGVGLVSIALIDSAPDQRHAAVVFPLLALADALEAA